MDIEKLFQGFSKLDREQRFKRLLSMGALNQADVDFLQEGGVKDLSLADHFIENSIGYFQLPLGVATNFKIDGVNRVIPMAVEETSIIAAASKTARWVRENGEIKTWTEGDQVIGQIQVARVKNYSRLCEILDRNKQEWILDLNTQVAASMVKRGGGVEDIITRRHNWSFVKMKF